MSLLIKNGRVVTADREQVGDVFIEGEKISEVGPRLDRSADRVIDAAGKYVIPGGVDVHTHLEAPVGGTVSSDDFESGTRAAAFGGTTCIIDFATQSRGETLMSALRRWHDKAAKATVDFGLHMIVADLDAAPVGAIEEIVREGVTSLKVFMAYPGTLMMDDRSIFRVLEHAGRVGALVCVHAEDGVRIASLVRQALLRGEKALCMHARTRPSSTEAEAIERAVELARLADVPVYIVHVTCRDGLEAIAGARSEGYPVFGETCPHYLLLTARELERPRMEGAKYLLTPPLREEADQAALWDALRDDLLQVVSTDHCPFNYRGQKDRDTSDFTRVPNGGPGIEHRLELLFHYGVVEQRLSLRRWVEVVSETPARLFGLYPRKGTIAVGSDADVVVWDPSVRQTLSARTHHMQVDYSMYEGLEVQGGAEVVISRGEVIVSGKQWSGQRGRGRFVKRNCFGEAWGERAHMHA